MQKESNICPSGMCNAHETLRYYEYAAKPFPYLFMILPNLVIYFSVGYKPKL